MSHATTLCLNLGRAFAVVLLSFGFDYKLTRSFYQGMLSHLREQALLSEEGMAVDRACKFPFGIFVHQEYDLAQVVATRMLYASQNPVCYEIGPWEDDRAGLVFYLRP